MNSETHRRLNELYHDALERAPEDPEAYVRTITSLDESLKEELISLLKAHRKGDRFLEHPFSEADEPLRAGDSIGSYSVRTEIGRGGMGVVYLAEDTRLHRRVALKALSPDLLSDAKQVERFRREAEITARFSHPSIATVFALEENAGRFFIVSEFVPGRSLRVEIERGKSRPDRVLEVGIQLAEGLAVAHEEGIVHRDLKPENVLRVDETGVKIVDFGLAISPRGEFDQRLTHEGTFVGTPRYMSPEQLSFQNVDSRSDLFSLGIVLYELALGEHPFGGRELADIVDRILHMKPMRGDELLADVPELGRVILKCLEKSPEDRFASARAVADDLRRVGAQGTLARSERSPDSEIDHDLQSHWWVVHQVLVIVLYTVMIILLFVANRNRGDWRILASAFVLLASGAGNGALRVHLLFTYAFNKREIRSELRRTRWLIRSLDPVFSLTLLVAAVLILPSSQPWAASLASVGAVYAVVSMIVEPATVRSVFSEAESARR